LQPDDSTSASSCKFLSQFEHKLTVGVLDACVISTSVS